MDVIRRGTRLAGDDAIRSESGEQRGLGTPSRKSRYFASAARVLAVFCFRPGWRNAFQSSCCAIIWRR